MRRPGTDRRAGLATVAALVLAGLASVALLAMVTLIRHDLIHTRRAIAETQLRQLLLAAEVAASESLTAGEGAGGPMELALPEGFDASSKITMLLEPLNNAPGRLIVTAEAQHDGFFQAQTLHYRRTGAEWVLESATLNGPPGHFTQLPEQNSP